MPAPSQPQTLERVLGPVDAAALVISNVIGVGIFTTPGIVAQMVPHPLVMLGLWAVGGALAFAGASAYAELAALRPRAGGEYVYLREAFGPLAGFLTGWTSFVAGFSGAIAAGAVGLAAYLGRYFPAAADAQPLIQIPLLFVTLRFSPRTIVAVSAIFIFSVIHIRGLGPGRKLQNTLTGLEVLALLLLVALGLTIGTGSVENLQAPASQIHPMSWLLALVPIMFTYSGWNAAAYVAEEVHEPRRNVPRALALGTASVVVLYLMLNLVYLYGLPPSRLAGSVNTAEIVAEALLGRPGAELLTPVILVALAGGISAMIVAGPRVYFAMARDGVFPRAAARVHQRYHTPAAAILAQAIWSALLVVSGTFEQILLFTGFSVVLFSGIAVLAVFVLRRTRAGEARPVRTWGYPLAPALFAIFSLAMVINAIRERPLPSAAGLLVISAGIPIYWWSTRRAAPK